MVEHPTAKSAHPHRRSSHPSHRGVAALEHQRHTYGSVHLTDSWTLRKTVHFGRLRFTCNMDQDQSMFSVMQITLRCEGV